MTNVRTALLGANVLVWGGFAWLGRDAVTGAGAPNFGQIQYYLIVPLLLLSVTTIPALVLWQTRASMIGTIWAACGLLALVLYVPYYTGGI